MNRTRLWHGAMLLWASLALLLSSNPTSDFLVGSILMIAAIVLAILWFIRFVAALHHPVRRLLIIQEAVVAIGMTLLAISPLPRNIRFRLSEPALTAYLRQPHEGEHITVGLYKFRSIENTEEGWLFNLEDTALTQEGFLYHTGPAPKNDKLYLHKRLSGSWYLWTYDAF